MFRNLFKKKAEARHLTSPRDLLSGDILELKPRSILPDELEGASLTVKKVQAYEYSDGIYPEFVLEAPDGLVITMMCSPEEEEDAIIFSRQLKKAEVNSIFDRDELSELWEDGSATIHVNKAAITELASWLPDEYYQEVTSATGYFINDDLRHSEKKSEDNYEQLQYHECVGSEEHLSFNVEVWEDGTTDFFIQASAPFSVIAEMWPSAP